jgi:hypothetical protein
MRSKNKLIKRTSNSERGFILVVALMAMLILTAVGLFALTMISGDLMISYRLTGDRKALSAAESGVYSLLASPNSISYLLNNPPPTTCIQVDPTNDPSTCYTVSATTNTWVQAPVGNGGQCFGCKSFIYNTNITGKDSNYSSLVTISIGMAPPSQNSDPNIPAQPD